MPCGVLFYRRLTAGVFSALVCYHHAFGYKVAVTAKRV